MNLKRYCAVLAALCTFAQCALSQSISQEQVRALSPLLCGSCFESPSDPLQMFTSLGHQAMSNNEFLNNDSRQPWLQPLLREFLVTYGSGTKEDQLKQYVIVPGGTQPKTEHVCIGQRFNVQHSSFREIVRLNDRASRIVPILAAADGVCFGSLVHVVTFFQQIVNEVLLKSLQTYEARLSNNEIKKIVDSTMPDALAKLKGEIVAQVKSEVLKDVRPQTVVDTPTATPTNECKNTMSCGLGVPTSVCCKCIRTDGSTIEGVCNVGGGSFKPRTPP
jgi:hypothetical protein